MRNEYQRIRIPTLSSGLLEVETNYSASKRIRDGRVMRFHFGGKTMEIKTEILLALFLNIGDPLILEKALPRRITKVRRVEKQLVFSWIASLDYRKGDKITITAPYVTTVLDDEELMEKAVKNSLKAGKSFKIK